MPITVPSWRERRDDVTWPIGPPLRQHHRALGRDVAVAIVKPTSAVSAGCSAACSSAQRPMKSCSLSSLTIHGIAAPYGVDSESVSWPTMTCSFCSRSTRCGSSPNGRAPAATSASHTCSP